MGKDCSGRAAPGSACLKVVGVLRVRGRGIEELCFMSGEVIRFFIVLIYYLLRHYSDSAILCYMRLK